MVKVLSVVPMENYRLFISMSDGQKGTFDVKPYIKSEFFKQLLDKEYFKKVTIFFNGIGWPDGQDLGPDTICSELKDYEVVTEI